MKLKKLDITGFKSFNEKATIAFPKGISAIVGPNGCGKSNVIDAIRWVMGEQSAKQLRGKSMEDIIFSGTNGQPPLNMAEVSLTLLNDNGSAPEELRDFSEIMLTRRVYRSGERSYFINKQPCRLKDIYNIFYGSGMGPKSYAVIQQGNIGAITDANPEERRYFIEEAAGITRYKNRKTEALRKVASTNQNLLRLNDILLEIKRQMSGLKRQAKKAERYKHYQERIRTLDALISIRSYDDLSEKIEKSQRLLKELKDEDVGYTVRLQKIDAAVEQIKFEKEKKNQEISTQKSELSEKQRINDRIENDLSHFRDMVETLNDEISSLETARQNLETKNADITVEIEQVQLQNGDLEKEITIVKSEMDKGRAAAEEVSGRLAHLRQEQESGKSELMDLVALEAKYKNIFQNASNTKESVKRRLKRANEEEVIAGRQIDKHRQIESETREALEIVRREIGGLQEQIGVEKETLTEQSRALGEQVKKVQTLEFDRNKIRSKYTALKKMEENFEWYRDGVKAIMQPENLTGSDPTGPDRENVLCLMADVIEPEPSYETAVDAVLGESLQYILVKDQQTGAASIDYLQTREAGRSGFIPVSSVKPVDVGGVPPTPEPDRLLNHIKVKAGYEKIAGVVLGHVSVAPDITTALETFNRNGSIQTIVTPDGDVVSHQGIMIGGSRDKLSGILAKKKEIRDLKQQIQQMDGDLENARQQQKEIESEVRNVESRLQQLIENKNRLGLDEVDTEKALYKVSEELKHARRHQEIILLEQEQLQGEASDLDEELTKYDRAVSDITEKIKRVQGQVSGSSEKIGLVSSQVEEMNRQVMDLKLKLTSVNARLENSNHTLKRLEEFKNDTQERFGQVTRDISLKSAKIEATQKQIAVDKGQLLTLYDRIKSLETTLEINEADFQTIDTQLKDNDSTISEIQNRRESLLQKIRLLELDQSEQRMKRENVGKRLEEHYQNSIPDFRVEFRRRGDELTKEMEMTSQEMEDALLLYRTRISKITDVNLAAISEYDQYKERFDFLSEQRDDLINAVDDLHQVIKKINKITQERFVKTFTQINEKLDEVFPRLFEGGTAKLILTEPNNPLETGVEFMIHPPGKKLTRLSLLSGGEKALSAIAFIFSIFLIKPASFCLLDEIDAPLDDANVFRFNTLLQLIGEKSQVVMITHNKRSMEFADMLFGITMEKKGISKVVSVDLKQ